MSLFNRCEQRDRLLTAICTLSDHTVLTDCEVGIVNLTTSRTHATAPRTGAPRRPTQADRRARTRSEILAAAAATFARRGFNAASVDEIAEAAGVSKGAVYYTFPSKDDLFLALLDQRLGERLADMRSTPDSGSLERQAAQASQFFFARLDSDPEWAPLLLEFLAHSARESAAREVMSEKFFAASRTAVAEVLTQRTQAAGVELTVPVDRVAAGLTALANGLLIEGPFLPDDAPEDVMATIVGLILDGLIARAGAQASDRA